MEEILYGPPLKLFDLCINTVLEDPYIEAKINENDIRALPNTVLAYFHERLFQEEELCTLADEYSELDVIYKLSHVKAHRIFLISCYQILINHGTDLNSVLLETFKDYVEKNVHRPPLLIDIGLSLGSLLNDIGWFQYSIEFLNISEKLLLEISEPGSSELLELLECHKLKLFAETQDCRFSEASGSYKEAKNILRKLKKLDALPHLGIIYTYFSIYKYAISSYNEAYYWSQKSLKMMSAELTRRGITEVLRQASKACVAKRKITQAGFLITQALNLGELLYAKGESLIYSDILMDYGSFLINNDSAGESVFAYRKALQLREYLFDEGNLHLAKSHEELAYALYVQEYNSGNFRQATHHIDFAIKTMEKILPNNHFLLTSTKRIKALILEEQACLRTGPSEEKENEMLKECESSHLAALNSCKEVLGEDNVHAAKHFGNLGRLYQSMNDYPEAEKMFLKAIEIKEKILGPKHYEVGLSIGHLASLYNYHMKKYEEAEKLYLRSIEINFYLFGPSYSGFEYDFRGLIHAYRNLVDPESVIHYQNKYREWEKFREKMTHNQIREPYFTLKDLVKRFLIIEIQAIHLQEMRTLMLNDLIRKKDNTNSEESDNNAESHEVHTYGSLNLYDTSMNIILGDWDDFDHIDELEEALNLDEDSTVDSSDDSTNIFNSDLDDWDEECKKLFF